MVIQYPLMISPENANLSRVNLKTLISLTFKVHHVLFIAIIFYFNKNVNGRRI